MFNRLFAIIILIILSPILLAMALAIFLEDGSPIFFKQKRVGINYTFFNIYKFRSMKKNTPNVATHVLENPASYLLRIGGVLRKLSLDELPNLINIIKGEMVFVGPRPALYNQDDLMTLRVATGVKAIADEVDGELSEEVIPNPITYYGKSKLLAEQYILSNPIPKGKRVYILRPCMIHGPGNKGNLNLLYSMVSKGIPWPLGIFENSRSYLSIENLCFIVKELIDREDIPSGVYNVADDVPLSTNEVVKMIGESKGKKAKISNINMNIIQVLAGIGDVFKLPLNSERLQKLTESYVVSNAKIKEALGKQLPFSSKEGLIKTFQSFSTL